MAKQKKVPLAAKSKEIAAGREDSGGERGREGAAARGSNGERERRREGAAARGSDSERERRRSWRNPSYMATKSTCKIHRSNVTENHP